MRYLNSTAEIKLLPISDDGQPPYWNFTSSFEFDLYVIIRMSFCIRLQNFVVIGRTSVDF